MPEMTKIRIARCYKSGIHEKCGDLKVQLHHFCDASEKAYACVSYLRFDDGNTVHIAFVMAKSRVAPAKQISMPRMELSGAVLAVRLNDDIRRELNLTDDVSTFYWTDSTAVLMYIHSVTGRFQTFVANRLSIIHDGSQHHQWKFVDGKDNPADRASRGVHASELVDSVDHWLHGPSFLSLTEHEWPKSPMYTSEDLKNDPERKQSAEVFAVISHSAGSLHKLLTYYSSYSRLKCSIAWLKRFRMYLIWRFLKKGACPPVGNLRIEELRNAELEIIRVIQRNELVEEFDILSSGELGTSKKKNTTKGSRLSKLNPVVKDGLICIGGRLRNLKIESMKNPIVLPNKHHVTNLIIQETHDLLRHVGIEHTLAEVRLRFWIINGRSAVRRVLSKCIKCKKLRGNVMEQRMADLPANRVTPDQPAFYSTGVDLFGPMLVKQGRSRVKRWGCLFTCLNSRAIHIEVVHSLDTSSFINALRRFISRRGNIRTIRSDCGTNFQGADKELKEQLKKWNQHHIHKFLQQIPIEWLFNPPSAAHYGGVWERLIRSVKEILKFVASEQLLTDEGLVTVMTE
ncbi:MAG: hypothetical protein ACKE51_09515, partial [Methylococcaceae bacterium]